MNQSTCFYPIIIIVPNVKVYPCYIIEGLVKALFPKDNNIQKFGVGLNVSMRESEGGRAKRS